MEYTPETAAEFWKHVFSAELKAARPYPGSTRLDGFQVAAAKGRATIKFKKACQAYWDAKKRGR